MSFHDDALDDSLTHALNAAIGDYLGAPCRIDQAQSVGGGSISRTLIVRTGNTRWFVKLNRAKLHDMFAAEADGLSALGVCPALRVPRVVAHGVSGRQTYLVLEHLSLRSLGDGPAGQNAGRALATLHRVKGEEFGWHRDNFIGSTPQLNASHRTWPLFFAQQRLKPQLDLAKQNGHKGRIITDGERLLEKLPALFVNYQPSISLLHGDLWRGNAGLDESGKLALYDPAVYYGDRETDLAMAELFGGFPAGFYSAYRESWPLADGHEQRKTLYKLYHVLNHLNLFGSGYLHQSKGMIDQLLAELG